MLKKKICKTTAEKFNDDIPQMLDYVKENLNAILEIPNADYNDFLPDLWGILGTVKNKSFCDYIGRKKLDWKEIEDEDMTPDALMHMSVREAHCAR